MLGLGIVDKCVDYLKTNCPPLNSAVKSEDPKWKEFVMRPALRHVLQIMAGLSAEHEPTQNVIAGNFAFK